MSESLPEEKDQTRLDLEDLQRRGIAFHPENLPPLPEGFVRSVHITNPEELASILEKGLDYSRQGMLMSTARSWEKPDEVEFVTDDPRFAGGIDVVLDLPYGELRLHNDVAKSPGVVPPERIVGVIDPKAEPSLTNQDAHTD